MGYPTTSVVPMSRNGSETWGTPAPVGMTPKAGGLMHAALGGVGAGSQKLADGGFSEALGVFAEGDFELLQRDFQFVAASDDGPGTQFANAIF